MPLRSRSRLRSNSTLQSAGPMFCRSAAYPETAIGQERTLWTLRLAANVACRSGAIGWYFVIMKCYLSMPRQRATVIEFVYIQ
jgi:hypothetical protein